MDESPGPRSKRQKIDRGGRFAALERLREMKSGSANKWQNEEVDNVYDTVEESEYEKIVLDRADDDWIVDDGTGYVEDGREIFDEDDDDQPSAGRKKSVKADANTSGRSKKRLRDINAPVNEKASIKRMFGNATGKKSETKPKLAEDDILSDILGELDADPADSAAAAGHASASSIRPAAIAVRRASRDGQEKKRVSEFMQGFVSASSATSQRTDKSDDAIIDEILRKQAKKPAAPVAQLAKAAPATKASQAALLKPKEEPNRSLVEEQAEASADRTEPQSDVPDMDYSVLDDDDNQFETAAPVQPARAPPATAIETSDKESFDRLLANWENTGNLTGAMAEEFASNDDDAAAFGLADDGDAVPVRFWLWDAWEDPFKKPGQLFLFGKIAVDAPAGKSEYKSACVRIENIERLLYLLPREFALDPATKKPTRTPVNILDVYNEFTETISPAVNVSAFRSRKVSKNFCFSVPVVDVPATCDYLEVRYDGTRPAPSNKPTYNHVAHIFGTATNALETFMLELKIKGPCWLNIAKYSVSKTPLSWAKVELSVPRASECVSLAVAGAERLPPPPPLVLTTLNVQTAINPKTMKNEVCLIAVLVNRSFSVQKPPVGAPFQEHFCAFTRPVAQNWPHDLAKRLPQFRATRTHKLDSERALLGWFLATFQRIDPDMLVVHDAQDCQLDVICDRVAALKIPLWSRLGRLRMSVLQPTRKYREFFVGRMICDVKHSAEELIKSRSYDLDTLCRSVLKTGDADRQDVCSDDVPGLYETTDGILRLITLSMQDAAFVLRILCELNVLPLAMQITTICGTLMGRTLQGGRSERNEWLLLHAFVERNYIAPDRKLRDWTDAPQNTQLTAVGNESTAGGRNAAAAPARKKPQYAGGLVLDPIKGFYDKFVLLMDFNSLYPSIIQEYNICFTTVDEPDASADAQLGETGEPRLPALPEAGAEPGVLPQQIRRLVESRREVKKLMAAADLDSDQRAQYDIRQIALKLTANSMYGCLGFQYSRFYAQHLAAMVTSKGREILLATKSLVQKLNHQVIYGDTDSIMINTYLTDYEQVFRVGNSIKQAVNKMYRQVELDIDGVFKYLLLLKKKKYAAITMQRLKNGEMLCKRELKGLDIVRRDWSQIAVKAGELVLDELLSDAPMDDRLASIHAHLERFRATIDDGSVPVSLLTITKQLTKAPKEYASNATLPHVLVALRMNAERNRRYKRGDMVEYVICTDGTDRPAMQRAYHVDELKATPKDGDESPPALKIDAQYYLAQQIHPVVSRLLEPIDGTDAGRIATCLGMDASKYKAAAVKAQRDRSGDVLGESIVKTSGQKFRDCERFTFKCAHCSAPNLVASALRRNEQQQLVPVLEVCANRECGQSPATFVPVVRNQLVLAMRAAVRRFYENWLVCDEPNCSSNTRLVTHVLAGANASRPLCTVCKKGGLLRQYGERELFAQLSYYQYMFDLSKNEALPAKMTPEVLAAYASLTEAVEQQLQQSAFAVVKLAKLFPIVSEADEANAC